MLLYLPERIYNVIKDDKNYKIMAEKATKQIFGENDIDFLKIIYNYENSNEIIKELQNYIYKNTPEEYHLELKLSFSDDLSEFEKDFDKMDMETKLYWLCEMEDGNMSLTKDFNSRNMKFLRLYRNNVLPEKEKYSEFLHCMYYSKLIYEKIIECTEKEKNLNLVKDFFKYESKIFNEIVSFSDLEAFKHMMHSKREQMFVLFYEFIGQFCSEYIEVNNFIVKKLNNKNFKYNKYNYFKLMFYSLCFQQLIDKHQLNEAKLCLDNIIKIINYSFNNKSYAVSALNHYNNAFIDEFINYSKFVYTFIKLYMPILFNEWGFIKNKNLSELEIRYFENKLFSNEQNIYSKYIKRDNHYSTSWTLSSKNVLSELDKLYS